MKYKVTDSFLQYAVPDKDDEKKIVTGQFKRDQFVTVAQLENAGFDVKFLLDNKSIEKPEGQDDDDAPAAKPVAKSPIPHLSPKK